STMQGHQRRRAPCPSFVWHIAGRRAVGAARVLTEPLGQLRDHRLQFRDAFVLLGDPGLLLSDAFVPRGYLRLEFGDPFVAPVACHAPTGTTNKSPWKVRICLWSNIDQLRF